MKVRIDIDLIELIPQFKINREKDFLYLRDLLFQKRYSEAKEVIHSLKGVLGSYGFYEASTRAARIDELLQKENYMGLMELARELEEGFRSCEIDYIQEECL